MPSFDLLTEPWIPILDAGTDLRATPDAATSLREVGLREALLRAHEIREVYTDSPLETIALNRLLLALALDVYQREPDVDRWRTLWKAGRFRTEPLDAYLRDWGDRFDLLHPEHPFYQAKDPAARDAAVPSKLFHQLASGNNATLFSHDLDSFPTSYCLDELARGLVAIQSFGFSGLAGAAVKGGRLPNFAQGPLVGRVQFWIRGRSLFDALLLNGPPYSEARMDAVPDDAPIWRSELSEIPQSRQHRGLLDMLTWPSRRVTFAANVQDEEVVAEGVFLSPGDKLDPQPIDDPLSAHFISEKKGILPLALRPARALWRDASTIYVTANPTLKAKKGVVGAPATFRWVASFLSSMAAPADSHGLKRVFREHGVDAFGIATEKGKAGKAEVWRHERLPLFAAILQDRKRQVEVERALQHAEDQVKDKKKGLRRAVRVTAEYALAPPAPADDGVPNADPKAVSALSQSLGAESRYWAALEPRFFRFLSLLADAADESERSDALVSWQRSVFEAAEHAFDAATSSFDRDARHLRATAEGRARLRPIALTAAP